MKWRGGNDRQKGYPGASTCDLEEDRVQAREGKKKMQEKRIAQDCEWRSGPTAFLLYFGLFFPYYSPFIFVAEKSSWELSEKS
jgi:hypothetical protein